MINSNFKKTRKQCVIFSVEEKLDYVKLMNKANIKAIKPKRRQGWSYLASVLDLASRQVAG
jgi:hypothetical protein